MVESSAEQFKVHFAGSSMRWSRRGTESLLPIPVATLGGRSYQMWVAAENLPHPEVSYAEFTQNEDGSWSGDVTVLPGYATWGATRVEAAAMAADKKR